METKKKNLIITATATALVSGHIDTYKGSPQTGEEKVGDASTLAALAFSSTSSPVVVTGTQTMQFFAIDSMGNIVFHFAPVREIKKLSPC